MKVTDIHVLIFRFSDRYPGIGELPGRGRDGGGPRRELS